MNSRGERYPDVKQAFARFRWRNAARRAGKKPNAKARFELTDCLAQRRLRDAKLRCGFREASLVSHRDKGPKVIQISALHLSFPLIGPCGL
jgi:hypothetical protein